RVARPLGPRTRFGRDAAPTDSYSLSLPDALPIWSNPVVLAPGCPETHHLDISSSISPHGRQCGRSIPRGVPLNQRGVAGPRASVRCLIPKKMPLPEQDRRGPEVVAVGLLPESVSLVVEHHEPHRLAVGAHGGGDLLGFGIRDARVVPALRDEQRGVDAVRVLQ